MRRVSSANEWEETTLERAMEARYGDPFPFANALVYGELVKPQ
jgi:hypothetical protein